VIIDVRTQAEYDADHLDGAVLISHEQIGEHIAAVVADKGAPIALYCASGRRAELARQTLHAMGYTHVENMGGLEEARARFEPQP
jgi:phage shock protein E